MEKQIFNTEMHYQKGIKVLSSATKFLVVATMLWQLVDVTTGSMLKDLSCGLYDAEFSRITYGKKLALSVVELLTGVDTRRCVTNCSTHPACKSVNYNRREKSCELLNATLNFGGGASRSDLAETKGWNHIDTRNKIAVTILCVFSLKYFL